MRFWRFPSGTKRLKFTVYIAIAHLAILQTVHVETLCCTLKYKQKGIVAGGQGGPWPPNFFEIIRCSEILMLHLKMCSAIAFGKDKGLKLYRNIIELDPPYSASATAPLSTRVNVLYFPARATQPLFQCLTD